MADSLYTVFHKFCPQCAASTERDAEYCACGYSFNADASQEVASPLAQAIAEEKLYEDYLAARVTQTAQSAIAAQSVHQTAPQDSLYALAARNAVEEAERSRAELAAQSAKLAEMEKALAAEQEELRTGSAKRSTPLRAVAEKPVRAQPAAVTAPPLPQPVEPMAAAPQKQYHEEPVQVTPIAAAPIVPQVTHEPARIIKKNLSIHANEVTSAAEALRAELAQMRGGRNEAIKSAPQPKAATTVVPPIEKPKPQQAVSPSPVLAPVTAKPESVNASPRPVSTKAVTEILEQASTVKKVKREAAQAAKAQQIQQARLARQAERALKAQSTPAPQTSREASTAAKTEAASNDVGDSTPLPAKTVMAQTVTPTAIVKSRECANCTATVALSVQRCKCGYEFPNLARATMPALALDPAEAKNVVDLYHRRQ